MTPKTDTDTPDRRALLLDHDGELEALDRAAREAAWRHKRLGHPWIIWQDGRVVEIPADEIPDEWCSKPLRPYDPV